MMWLEDNMAFLKQSASFPFPQKPQLNQSRRQRGLPECLRSCWNVLYHQSSCFGHDSPRILLLLKLLHFPAVKQRSAPGWWSEWESQRAPRKMMPSGWWRPAATRPPSSAARHASPTVLYSADEQVPNHGFKTGKCREWVQRGQEPKRMVNNLNTPEVSCEGSSGCSSRPRAPGVLSWLQGRAHGWSSWHTEDWWTPPAGCLCRTTVTLSSLESPAKLK